MNATVKRSRESLSRVRFWLRRVMPRVAVGAGVSFVLRALVQDFFPAWHDISFFGSVLDFVTTLLVVPTLVYYGYKTLRWLKRKLLWRVRRRLIITYLFVGLTPIVLFALLAMFFVLAIILDSRDHAISAQVEETRKLSLANVNALADALTNLSPNAGREEVQKWLDERNSSLQASLPGARLAVWRSAGDKAAADALGESEPVQFVSVPAENENTRGVGSDAALPGAPLPEWLRGQTEWSAFVYVPPAAAADKFAAPSFRALARRRVADGQRAWAALLIVPLNRTLVRRFRDNTGMQLHPYFYLFGPNEGLPNLRRSRDQFGEPLAGEDTVLTFAMLTSTNWLNGKSAQRPAFLFQWSQGEALKQMLGTSNLGRSWRGILSIIGSVFLVLQLLAIFSAAWMTRAVTGTVHKLYQATEFIKRGDFSHRVKARSHDQLGELALAFNEMSANVETLLQERVKHERLEREVEIAAEVQTQLFPREVPRLASAEIIGECRAARGVAGDYYDYAEIVPGLIAFALGDVAGKGISASLVMSNLQASLRAQVTILAERWKLAEAALTVAATSTAVAPNVEPMLEQSLDLPCGVTGVDTACAVENMAASINEQLCRSTDSNRFATFFLALYDDRTRRLRYTNAGHNDPLLVRADGSVEKLNVGGTVLGAFEWVRYEEAATTLAPGDLLLVFSDGLSEAQNTLGEEYGEERLAQFAAAHRHHTAGEIRRAVFEEIDNWSGGQERGDDQTVVILKAVV